MSDGKQKQSVLRYAELAFKQKTITEQGRDVPKEITDELQKIRIELGHSHEKILELASQNLIDE